MEKIATVEIFITDKILDEKALGKTVLKVSEYGYDAKIFICGAVDDQEVFKTTAHELTHFVENILLCMQHIRPKENDHTQDFEDVLKLIESKFIK